MDLVLVGLPGSGKSVVGRRIAHRHDATFIDLDDTIVRRAGRSVEAIFEAEGETGFRVREAEAVDALGPADADPKLRRVIATGGGTVVDPRNRWRLNRDRLVVWLDARPEALAQRLRHSRTVRPLVAGRDPIGAVRSLGIARERFYATAQRVNALAEPAGVAGAIETLVAAGPPAGGTRLLDAETRIGRFILGDGIAVAAVAEALDRLEARRAIIVSEPAAWAAAGVALADGLRAHGLPVEYVELPSGEAAKRLSVVEEAGRALARLRVERSEPIVAVGGGGLGDTAGLLAALWQRGIPVVHVPTTLVAQIDSAIGGKTAVDLPEGKNLLGAFHQPAAVVIDIAFLRTLPERQRRAALGEAVKMAALGDEPLFSLLEQDGEAIAHGDEAAFGSPAPSPSSSSGRCGPRWRWSCRRTRTGHGCERRHGKWRRPVAAGTPGRARARSIRPAARAGSRSISVIPRVMRSRQPADTRACSTARPSRTGSGSPFGSAFASRSRRRPSRLGSRRCSRPSASPRVGCPSRSMR